MGAFVTRTNVACTNVSVAVVPCSYFCVLKNEDDLKDEDNLKNEDDLKNEDNLKNWSSPPNCFVPPPSP